jgi:hypothetical protein
MPTSLPRPRPRPRPRAENDMEVNHKETRRESVELILDQRRDQQLAFVNTVIYSELLGFLTSSIVRYSRD